MSNVTIFKQGGAVSTHVRRESELGKAFASSGGGMRRIQLNTNGTFKRIVNGEQIGKAARGDIDVIIVSALPKVSREYYEKPYDSEAKPTLPDCWSNLGDKPEAASPNPQASNCAECPMNVVGSGKNGKGRACRFQRRLGVLVMGDPQRELYQLKIPSKSLFGKGHGNIHPFESYVKFLLANGEAPDTVITNVAYDSEADSMELVFSPQRSLDDEEYALVKELQKDPDSKRYCMLTAAQVDGVTAKPATGKIIRSEEPDEDEEEEVVVVKAAPAPKPSPIVELDDDEDEPKPVKRTVKKAEPAPAPKKDLSAVIDAWGDEEDE